MKEKIGFIIPRKLLFWYNIQTGAIAMSQVFKQIQIVAKNTTFMHKN